MHGKCIDAFARTLYTQTLIVLVVAFGSTYEDSAYVRACVCVMRVTCVRMRRQLHKKVAPCIDYSGFNYTFTPNV